MTEALVFPTLRTLNVPSEPRYRGGKRASVTSFGTTNLEDFSGTTEDLIETIHADFNAVKRPVYYYTGEISPKQVKDSYVMVNDQTDEVIGKNLTERYTPVQFTDAIYYYMGVINELERRGFEVTPFYGQVFGGGSKMFLQHKIRGGQLMGEPVDTYLALLTSHDASTGFTLALSAVRLFCQNQIHRMLKNATNRITLKHTKNSTDKILAGANKMIELEAHQTAMLEEYLDKLSKVKVTETDIFNAYAEQEHLLEAKTQLQIDHWCEKAEQLIACYRMPDVSVWNGTALGAYYAMSDMLQHCEVGKQMKTESGIERRNLSLIEKSLGGNTELGRFADILTKGGM